MRGAASTRLLICALAALAALVALAYLGLDGASVANDTSRAELLETAGETMRAAEDASSLSSRVEREAGGAFSVVVRVVDEAGAPAAGIPVALGDPSARDEDTKRRRGPPRRWPLPSDPRLSLGLEPYLVPVTSAGQRRDGGWRDLLAMDSQASRTQVQSQIVELAAGLFALAETDALGEARLPWSREERPRVEARFAFPSRTKHVRLLDAATAELPARVTLTLPLLERVIVSGVEDLEGTGAHAWRVRVAARVEHVPRMAPWTAWSQLERVEEHSDPRILIWESGIPARLEASVDAPLAPGVVLPLGDRAGELQRVELRASDHYALVRARVVASAGARLARRKAILQCAWLEPPRHLVPRIESAEIELGDEGEFCALVGADPGPGRPRTLAVRLVEEGVSDAESSQNVQTLRDAPFGANATPRDPRLDALEHYVDLGIADAPGSRRDLGELRLGAGAHLLAGVARWEDGTPVAGGSLILPALASRERLFPDERLQLDESGRFRRLGVPSDGSVEIGALAAGTSMPTRFVVDAGSTNLELLVKQRGGLGGRVLLDAWMPLDILVRCADGEEVTSRTQANGQFLVLGVPVGTHDVVFRSGGVDLRTVFGVAVAALASENPEALREINLCDASTPCTLELRGVRGMPVRAKTKVRIADAATGFRIEGETERNGRFAFLRPSAVARFTVTVEAFQSVDVEASEQLIVVTFEPAR